MPYGGRGRQVAIVIVAVIAAGQSRAQLTGTTTQLTTNPAPQLDPAISGDLVVFTDQRNGNDDVYYYDIATDAEVQVTSSTTAQRLQDVDGSSIVFIDLTPPGARVVAYDVPSAATTQLTPGPSDQNPRIDGTLVAFQRGPTTNTDVYVVDVTSGVETAVATTTAIEQNPAVTGTRVVYERHATSGAPGDIVMRDLATGVETVLAGSALDERRPDIDGDLVAWEVVTASGELDVAIYDVATGLTKTLARAGNQRIPHVSGRIVAFDDDASGNPDVSIHHVDLNTTTTVAAEAAAEFLNDIDGNRVVYTSNASGNLDIWMFEFTVDAPKCEASDDLCADTTGHSSTFEAEFVRESGTPIEETYTFAATPGAATVVVNNHGCASAVGELNGVDLVLPSDLNPDVTCFLREVELAAENTITVEVRSAPGCSIEISVLTRDECAASETETASCAGMNASASGLFALALIAFARRRR